MKIRYTKYGDYYFPNLALPINNKHITLGKYARMRLNYLKNNKKAEYAILLMNNELINHLLSIDKQANDFLNSQISLIAEREGINENLKQVSQLEWVGKMNHIKNAIEEIIFEKYIYN